MRILKVKAENLLITSICSFVVLSSTSALAADNTLRVCMGIAAIANIFSKVSEPFEKATGIKIVGTQANAAGAGSDEMFRQIDGGETDIAVAPVTFEAWLQVMKEKSYVIKNPDEIKYRVIGRDLIQFITYPGGPGKLSREQLERVLLGKAKSWKDVGGEDVRVTLVLITSQPATQKFLEEHFLKKQKMNVEKTVLLPESARLGDLIAKVAGTKGAIAFTARSAVTSAVNAPAHDDIGRPMTLIYKGKPSDKMEKFLSFLKAEGPALGVTL